ncbi:Uncharacterised protein [Mycolicibacterium flavescens]|uniref:hypothetical protein n=1 Tax=Mycobacterium neumannii TaxID=2048551 RepID=UPI000B940FAA|nr:hypothetical protein [Mycobacterium neumannii]VEG40466.1 Uncharacterised protein [Mycolicibacterium flavescens]
MTPVSYLQAWPEVVLIAATPPARLAFQLNPRTVRSLIPAGTPGTYLLLQGERPVYVGRSDRCLRARLATHNHLHHATHVTWETARDAWGAFLLEAWWWHQHSDTLINKIHPAAPTGQGPCPFCEPRTDSGLANALPYQSITKE